MSDVISLEHGEYIIRFIRSPTRSRSVFLHQYAEDEHLQPSVIAHFERVLGVKTGFPSRPHRDDDPPEPT